VPESVRLLADARATSLAADANCRSASLEVWSVPGDKLFGTPDLTYESCHSDCNAHAGADLFVHCAWCKCRACAFCNASAPLDKRSKVDDLISYDPDVMQEHPAPPLPQRAPNEQDAMCQHMVSIATHRKDDVDAHGSTNRVIFRQLARELMDGKGLAQLWVTIYDKELPSTRMEYSQELSAELGPGGWATWGDRTLTAIFPRAAHSLLRHRGVQFEAPQYLGLYYFLTASLGMWDRTFGANYHSLKYWWRMEPDVLFSGNLYSFVATSAIHSDADCVLPGPFLSQNQMPYYGHWLLNPDLVQATPPQKRMWSIVVIGRYSRRMLDLLMANWDAGMLGYEEITMPMLCLNSPGCSLSQFGVRGAITQELSSRDMLRPYPEKPNFANGAFYSSKVQFRPEWTCQEYLRDRLNGTLALWHPVKDRSCLTDKVWAEGRRFDEFQR